MSDDLPVTPSSSEAEKPIGVTSQLGQTVPADLSVASGKEQEPFSVRESPLQHVSAEIELPPEVREAGVESTPEHISLPTAVEQAGVMVVNQPPKAIDGVGITQAKMLSDQDIASGLRQGIHSAWRWLATWLKRQSALPKRS